MKPVAYKNIEISTHEWLLKFSSERHAKQIQKKTGYSFRIYYVICMMVIVSMTEANVVRKKTVFG